MTEIDPKYAAKAALIAAARTTEEAARRVRKRLCFGYGRKIDELLALPSTGTGQTQSGIGYDLPYPQGDIPASRKVQLQNAIASIEIIARTQGPGGPDGVGRLGIRESDGSVTPLNLKATKYICGYDDTIAAMLRAAEADVT